MIFVFDDRTRFRVFERVPRRVTALVFAVIVYVLSCVSADADDGWLTAKYVPKYNNGTLFYIDVYTEKGIAAAMFEMQYDASCVKYRDIFVDDEAAAAEAADKSGVLKIAYCHSGEGSGKLFRLYFQATMTTDADFVIRMTEAVDGKMKNISPTAYTLTASIGRYSASGSGSGSGSGSSGTSSSVSTSSGKSDSSAITDDEDADLTEAISTSVYDLRKDRSGEYMMIGAGFAVAAGLMLVIGILIGKSRRTKSSAKPDNTGESFDSIINDPDESAEDTGSDDSSES